MESLQTEVEEQIRIFYQLTNRMRDIEKFELDNFEFFVKYGDVEGVKVLG